METLADRIAREGPINELDAVGWAIRLAKRIEEMHALGVIHGSVSPACLLMGGRDRAARARLLDVRRSPASVACQSPERVNGGGISQADDTWALACTLYAALTGNAAFGGADDAQLMQKILSSAPAPLAVFDVGDDDLQRIVDEAFARDLRHRITSVTALRQALEEWHPDPNVGALPAIEEDDPDPAGAADEDDERTLMRSAPAVLARHLGPGFALPAHAAPGDALPPADDEDEEDQRTMMRPVQDRHPPARLSGGAERSGAFAAVAPGQSGTFPAGAASLPDTALDARDDEEATRMIPSPATRPGEGDDDDDDQKTLMRSSATPEELAAHLARPAEGPPSPLRAPGAPPGAEPAPRFPAPPAVAAAVPLPAPAVPGAAPIAVTGAAASGPAPPRRLALWLVLLALLLAAGATFFLLRMR